MINDHIIAMKHLVDLIDQQQYRSPMNGLLVLSPAWLELKEHLCELSQEVS